MKTYVELHCTGLSLELQEVVISLLAHTGYEGFEISDNTQVKAYIPADNYKEAIAEQLSTKYAFAYTSRELAPQNWNRVWEAEYNPININNRIYIRASFHPQNPACPYELLITPEQTFGTGHHASTRLMLRMMLKISLQNRCVLDAGCGTAILAIMAHKAGASTVYAVDNNEWSYPNARLNIQQNKAGVIRLQKGDILDQSCFQDALQNRIFDVVLANLNNNLILAFLPMITSRLCKGGIFLVGGCLEEDAHRITATSGKYHFEQNDMLEEDQWVALQFVKK